MTSLPERGLAPADVRRLLAAAGEDDVRWQDGRSWSLVYDLPGEHAALVAEATDRFGHENALSDSAFPSARRFESAVVAMVASVLSPAAPAYGTFTSGGTESILLAVKAYRDRPGARGDVVLLPETAHPAFGKAAHYLGLRTRRLPVGPSGAVDPGDVAAALGPDTLLVAVSAPNFPYGAVDPVGDVARLAADRGVGVHVDAALGGLFLPFLDGGPAFGFDVEGVTSVSVDVHKYGYGAKGASVLLFASAQLRRASYYLDPDWPGGAYAASGVLGTRPVGSAAAAFAAMTALGRAGYRRVVGEVMATTRRLQDGLRDAAGLRVLGEPAMSVFAAGGDPDVVGRALHGLSARGWRIDALPAAGAMHFVVMPRHAAVIDALLADLRAALHDRDGARPVEAVSAYGVMVRGGGSGVDALAAHLDRRFDAGADGPCGWPA